jgi:signal transduction histidine kinase
MRFGSTLIPLVWMAIVIPALGDPETVPPGPDAVSGIPAWRVLTNTAQLRELTIPQAIHGWPLRLEGVVTLVDSNRSLLVLQDSAGALAIQLKLNAMNLRPGFRIRLESKNAVPTLAAFPDFPNSPAGSTWLPSFSAPTNWGNYYLARMHGFVTPPATGDYIFWIASKGASELWLSTNADPAGVRRIALVGTGRSTLPGQWAKYPTQSSGPIRLQAGQSYLIDALQEQHGGRDDTLSVAWQGPGIERTVIAGSYLSPYANRQTNGIVREHWNDYFVAAVEPLTSDGVCNSTIAVTEPHFTVLGEVPLPKADLIEVGAQVALADNYRWSEVEGMVGFAAVDGDVLTLELIEGKSHTRVQVLGWADGIANRLERARVRVRGVCESVSDGNGKRVAGVIWTPSPQQILEIESERGDLPSLKVIPISELNPANPNLAWSRRIRVRGTVVREGTNEFVIQGSGSFCGYASLDGIHWKPVAPPVEIAMADSALAGLSVSSYSANLLATAAFDSVTGLKGIGQSIDIFNATPAGEEAFDGSTFTVKGGGVGISSSFDQFRYVYQPLAGDGEIIARIKTLETGTTRAAAGIMIRDSVDTKSSFANLALTAGGGAVFQFRQKKDERGATLNLPGYAAPYWLKLTRRHLAVLARADENVSVRLGQEIDVAGSLEWEQGQPVLLHVCNLNEAEAKRPTASPRAVIGAISPASEPPTVQIAQLIPDEGESLRASSGSVRVRGVVTFNDLVFGEHYLSIQDQTAGVWVRLSSRFARRPLRVGDLVEFDLRSVNGKWPVPLEPSRINVLGTEQLPTPAVHPSENSLARRGEGHWTEFEGIVREANSGGTMRLMGKDGVMTVWVGETRMAVLRRYVDALVRVRGVPALIANNSRRLLVPSPEFIEVSEPAPAEPFVIPSLAMANLKNFNRRSSTFHRVKVSGVVTYRKDELLLLQDESGGVRISTVDTNEVQVGDLVEAAGFPDAESSFVSLSETLVRKTGSRSLPKPVLPSPAELQEGRLDASVIQLTGQLLEQRMLGDDQILELQSGQRIFRATLAKNRDRLAPIPIGSRVEVTGVCWTEPTGDSLAGTGLKESLVSSFEVLLRSPADVIVRQRPPWWTWKHTAATIASLVFVLAVALVWIRLLHRQVARRTGELGTAMIKLERETEISATLAERNRLAGELHDGLEQGLSAIMMQLEGLESKLAENPAEAGRHLQLARSMVRFSRTEVRHSLWDWKSPALASKDLGAALSEIVGQMSTRNHAQVTVEVSGAVLPLPPATEHHLLRIGQEALNNALKSARARTIQVQLNYSEQSVQLSVRDDGCGFVPETVLNGSAGHFGLQSLRSRARKMGGRLTVTSAPGQGTTIEVTVLVNDSNPRSINRNSPAL